MAAIWRLEKLYFLAKILMMLPVSFWILVDYENPTEIYRFLLLVFVYAIINLLGYFFQYRRIIKTENMVLMLSPFDAAFISYATLQFGPVYDNLYMLSFVLAGIVAIFIPLRKVLLMAGILSFSVIAANMPLLEYETIFQASIKIFYIYVAAGLANLIANGFKVSEEKLLETLDTLNERTWELESSQSMLENMYETTRALSAILDLNQVLKEILNIADEYLNIRKCTVLLVDKASDSLLAYCSLDQGKKTLYDPPISMDSIKSSTIKNLRISNRTSSAPAVFNTKSQVIEQTLISYGKVLGMIQIELSKKRKFSEQERKNLMIFANSAAVALDNAMLHKQMQDLTIIDELTSLYNYRYFRNKLTDEIRRADRYHQVLSILMVDVDHFKDLNDSEGHQTGNVILRELAGIVKYSVRDVDVVARFGGEEFMVILPQTQIEDAAVIAERMREQVEKSYFPNSHGQRDLKITISIGIASYPNGIMSPGQLLEVVDRALYQAKQDGRNCIRLAERPKQVTESKKT